MTKNEVSGIYIITNKISNKVYIGKSYDIYKRIKNHTKLLIANKHSNPHLQNAWNKYGSHNFDFAILEICKEDILDEREIFYIDKYNSYSMDCGYNQTLGGDGKRLSKEQRRKHQEHYNELFGHPIYQIDFQGNVVSEWSSARKAARELELKQDCIYECLKKHRRTYKGFIWIYKKELNNFNINNYQNKRGQKRKVIQFTLDMELVRTWDCAMDTRELGFDPSAVAACCKGKYRYHKGFRWRYVDEGEENIVHKDEPKPLGKRVFLINPEDLSVFKEWDSITLASKELNIEYPNLLYKMSTKKEVIKGYRCIREKDYLALLRNE